MEDFVDVDAYLEATDQWPTVISALRPLLVDSGLTEEIRWGKPCYCLGDGNVVLIPEFSDHLALMFFKGVLLDDPAGVLHAQGPNTHGPKRMKFTTSDQVNELAAVISAYVHEAIEHEKAGTELPERPDEELAPELEERLASDDQFAEAFYGLREATGVQPSRLRREAIRHERTSRRQDRASGHGRKGASRPLTADHPISPGLHRSLDGPRAPECRRGPSRNLRGHVDPSTTNRRFGRPWIARSSVSG